MTEQEEFLPLCLALAKTIHSRGATKKRWGILEQMRAAPITPPQALWALRLMSRKGDTEKPGSFFLPSDLMNKIWGALDLANPSHAAMTIRAVAYLGLWLPEGIEGEALVQTAAGDRGQENALDKLHLLRACVVWQMLRDFPQNCQAIIDPLKANLEQEDKANWRPDQVGMWYDILCVLNGTKPEGLERPESSRNRTSRLEQKLISGLKDLDGFTLHEDDQGQIPDTTQRPDIVGEWKGHRVIIEVDGSGHRALEIQDGGDIDPNIAATNGSTLMRDRILEIGAPDAYILRIRGSEVGAFCRNLLSNLDDLLLQTPGRAWAANMSRQGLIFSEPPWWQSPDAS